MTDEEQLQQVAKHLEQGTWVGLSDGVATIEVESTVRWLLEELEQLKAEVQWLKTQNKNLLELICLGPKF